MSGPALNSATVSSHGSYQNGGTVTLPGSGATDSWRGSVSASLSGSATVWTAYTGSLSSELSTLHGSAAFTDPGLTSLGGAGNAGGLAIAVPERPSALATETITYDFATPLAAGVSFLLWNPGAAGLNSSFIFSAQDASENAIVPTAGWTFTVENPFHLPSGTNIAINATAGVVSVTGYAPDSFPDQVVVVTPDRPITQIQVTAHTAESDVWGLAIEGTIPCFLAGTAIMTPDGPVPVERLVPGDRVAARFAGVARVAWVGRRRLDSRRHPRPEQVWPVRIRRDAVAPGVPARDLLLSPDHAVFLGGVLIPVRYLANGRSVFQDRSFTRIDYRHVELERHDVLLAEALPAESYLDTGNRSDFENAGAPLALHPTFAPRRWEEDACALLWGEGGPVEAVRARLLARAGLIERARAG